MSDWKLLDSVEVYGAIEALNRLASAYENNTGRALPALTFEGGGIHFEGNIPLEHLSSYGNRKK